MVKKALRGNRRFGISDIELTRKGRSFTVDTFRELSRKYSGSELYFILGIDAFLDLPKWKQPDVLLSLTNLVVISRPGYSFSDIASLPYLAKVPRKKLRELDSGKIPYCAVQISENHKCYLHCVTGMHISASSIRSLVKTGQEIRYLLPDSVKSYIISNKLYRR